MNGKSARLGCLDGLKGIGACIVAFAWHYQHFGVTQWNALPIHKILPFEFDQGWLMVELFFMLSGFGIYMGYEERVRTHEVGFKDYILRRIGRLYPLFFASTLATIVLECMYMRVAGQTFVYPNFDLYHIFLNLLLMQDGYLGTEWSLNGPSWCVSICMMMYMLFYFVCYRVRERRHGCYAFAACVVLGLALVVMGLDCPLANVLVGRGTSCFAIGALIANAYCRGKLSPERGYAALMVVLAAGVLYRTHGEQVFGNLQLAFIVGVAPCIVIAAVSIPWLRAFLSLRPFVMLGKLSMALYLLHYPAQLLFKCTELYAQLDVDYSSMIVWSTYVLATLGIALAYDRILRPRYEPWVSGLLLNSASGTGCTDRESSN